jgi:hypothetical protein
MNSLKAGYNSLGKAVNAKIRAKYHFTRRTSLSTNPQIISAVNFSPCAQLLFQLYLTLKLK